MKVVTLMMMRMMIESKDLSLIATGFFFFFFFKFSLASLWKEILLKSGGDTLYFDNCNATDFSFKTFGQLLRYTLTGLCDEFSSKGV